MGNSLSIIEQAEKRFGIEEVVWHDDPVTREELYQLIFFTEGKGHIQLDFETYQITAPCILFISEFQLFTTLEGEQVQGTVVQFSNDFFCIKLNRAETFCDAVIFNSSYSPLVPLTATERNKISFIVDLLKDELQSESLYQEEIITAQLKTLLLECAKIKLVQLGQAPVQRLSKTVSDF
ncbi:MAG: hypothetical protein AAFU60_11585, partial [Bacteroidota bacterium]